MRFDSPQGIDEIGVGIDLVKNTGRNQALDLADSLRFEVCPIEEPVFPSRWDRAQGSPQVNRVDR